MSVVSLLGVKITNNPAPFTAPYEFEITFECLEQLQSGTIRNRLWFARSNFMLIGLRLGMETYIRWFRYLVSHVSCSCTHEKDMITEHSNLLQI